MTCHCHDCERRRQIARNEGRQSFERDVKEATRPGNYNWLEEGINAIRWSEGGYNSFGDGKDPY